MKPEMTPIPENIQCENMPSKAREMESYNKGYALGLLRGRIQGLSDALTILAGDKK